MRVLISGGAGFIGSHTVDLLVHGGHEVIVLDSLDPSAHPGPPSYLNVEAEYVEGDVRSPDVWDACLRGVDAVGHLAGKVGLGVDVGDIIDYVDANDVGTATMLEAMHRAAFGGRLVLASSMVVYGEGAYRCPVHGAVRPPPRDQASLEAGRFEPPCPECARPLEPEAVIEAAPLDPRNVYAATKAHQEYLCAAIARQTGIGAVALRYHNVYGPRMPRDTPYAGVASIFRSDLHTGRSPRVFEDGGQLRDFVHVRDVARANVLALTGGPAPGGAFNVASGEPRTVLEMARTLAAAFGPDAPPPVVTGEFRLGDVRHVFASPDRAARELGFRAEIPFDEGVREFASAPLRGSVGVSRSRP